MDRIGKLLAGVIARQPGTAAVSELRVRLLLDAVLGEALAPQILDVQLRGGVLMLATANPALAHQVRLDADIICARLNASLQGRRVRELRVRIGRP